jgi:leucyl aminopeptidase
LILPAQHMQFSTKIINDSKTLGSLQNRIECLVVPTHHSFGSTLLSPIGQWVDKLFNGQITSAIKAGDVGKKTGQTLSLRLVPNGKDSPNIERVLLVNLGPSPEKKLGSKGEAGIATLAISEKNFSDASKAAIKAAMSLGCKSLMSALNDCAVTSRDGIWKTQTQVMAIEESHYQFGQLKSSAASKQPASALEKMEFVANSALDATEQKQGIASGQAIANGMAVAKTLGNLPGNFCTPTHLAKEAQRIGKALKFKVEILERKQIQALKMGSFLSVAQGSDEPPKLIVMHYQGASAKHAPIALVGKGITFDTGGISLKPGAEMDEMKYDMCGAASVIGTFQAVAQMKLKVNLVGVIPACENMPSGTATRPGDIFTSMSGQTIEVLNTDAEGRLVLCDALTFVQRFKPSAIVDIATLTGACIIALGHHHSGLFSNTDALAHELLDAGRQSGDTCWRMPLGSEYADLLKSNFADIANIGGRAGGSITAACFLEKFVGGCEWAHLDIAGTAWKSGAAKGSTGRPVPLLVQFVSQRAAS